ncbi:MAG: mechanosensitive ion channel [Promethearchaeota archaeon]|nr:MAG: mechanosensitive ion channel [Candidatus Lokiarchaeota archaeon]
MALFASDLEAVIFIAAVVVIILILNKIITFIFEHSEKIPNKYKISVNFLFKIISLVVVLFLALNGFPSFQLDPTYAAILTGSVSTAIAFASSGTFSNIVAGFALMIIRPFEIDDVVKIGDDVGVVRTIKLTKTDIETFDNVIIARSNSEVISSKIVNYSLKLGKIKRFVDFKRKIQKAEEEFPPYDILKEDATEPSDVKLKDLFKTKVKNKKQNPKVHNFIFDMQFPYKRFRLIVEGIDKVCEKYKDVFGFLPRYQVINFALKINVKFRLMTLDPEQLFEFQPEFAKDVYAVIHKYNLP